ncbi:MAG TPA: hypothetical protein VK116_04010, partial [Planctomycetota bacterium]|nr:hypothetical protein [Planctomycetota bacterium]
TRFAIDREKYGETVLATFEFGRPDVYLRVWQEHDGKRKLVFDTEAHPIEAWSHAWTLSDAPAFELDWAPGDRLTIELWDEDPFRDNRLERVELEGELSLFLLEGFQAGPSGHAVDFVTSHAFGK